MMNLQRFDAAELLDGDEAMAEYLNAAQLEDDPKHFTRALGNVARARGKEPSLNMRVWYIPDRLGQPCAEW